MSTIKVDTIATRTGSGNITASNTIAGTSATLSGTLAVTGNSTVSGTLGVGETTPLGKMHIKSGDSGASSVNANANELIIENSDYAGISILGENESNICFGDNEDPDVGRIEYHHSDNSMRLRTAAADKVVIASSGLAQFKSTGISAGNQVLQVIDDGATLFQIRSEDGNISFPQAGGGIYLGVTAGAASNLLNDYEEGTFTPTLVDSAGDLSPNYTFQAGQYTKVGNKVTFALRINSNSHDSDGDQLYVGGLPFAINFTNTSNRSYVQVDGNGFNLDTGSGYYKLVGQLTNTNQSITLLQQGDNNAQDNFRANSLQQTKEIYITGTYFTNS